LGIQMRLRMIHWMLICLVVWYLHLRTTGHMRLLVHLGRASVLVLSAGLSNLALILEWRHIRWRPLHGNRCEAGTGRILLHEATATASTTKAVARVHVGLRGIAHMRRLCDIGLALRPELLTS
jgi:hypothetical protein